MATMHHTPPELRGVRWGESDDMRPHPTHPVLAVITWLCILGLVAGVLAGLFTSY